MKILKRENRPYLAYIVTGLLCPIIMFIYYLNDMACMKAVVPEMILALISCIVALFAVFEYNNQKRTTVHWIAAIYLLPWIAVLPVTMVVTRGVKSFLHTRLLAFATMEMFAIAQVIIGIAMITKVSAARSSH